MGGCGRGVSPSHSESFLHFDVVNGAIWCKTKSYVFFLIFYIFSKIFKYPGKIPEICQFPKLSRKIPKIPENSRISGEVETLLYGGQEAARRLPLRALQQCAQWQAPPPGGKKTVEEPGGGGQERRQGVCLGGRGECHATAAPALKCCDSPEKVAERGGGGGGGDSATFPPPPENYHNGVGVSGVASMA